MFAHLDSSTLIAILFCAGVAAFFVGSAMDGVLTTDGFGVIGNMIVLLAGGFLAIFMAKHVGIRLATAPDHAIAAVTGGFVTLATLTLTKALLNRFGM